MVPPNSPLAATSAGADSASVCSSPCSTSRVRPVLLDSRRVITRHACNARDDLVRTSIARDVPSEHVTAIIHSPPDASRYRMTTAKIIRRRLRLARIRLAVDAQSRQSDDPAYTCVATFASTRRQRCRFPSLEEWAALGMVSTVRR